MRALKLPLLMVVLAGVGCGYMNMWSRKHSLKGEIDRNPSAVLVREYAPDSCFVVASTVELGASKDRTLVLAAVAHKKDGRQELVLARGWRPLNPTYSVLLPAGDYTLFVLEDLDGDGVVHASEVVGSTGPFSVVAAAAKDGFTVEGPRIVLDRSHPQVAPVAINIPAKAQGSIVDSLDDPVFDGKLGEMGLYDPARFLAHTQAYYFGLEPLDPAKTHVLFVHGVEGTPRDFKALAGSLDRTRFQPWFFYYPSGMPLDRMGAGLAAAMRVAGQAVGPQGQIVLVAHSMGGLVARSALGKLCANGHRPPWLAAYVSFAAAYGGNKSAGDGVHMAPVVVPSWKDIATGSPFLAKLFDPPLPKELPFLLFFGWGTPDKSGPEGAGDGVIALRSQLDPHAQHEAWRSFGFAQSHTGILEEPEAINLFGEWIGRYAGGR